VREPGDLVILLREGAMDERHIAAEIGEVLTGACDGRQSSTQVMRMLLRARARARVARAGRCAERARPAMSVGPARFCQWAQITLFKSVGAAIEDLCASVALYDRALAEPAGTFPTM
jgi:ornithine cyclodeaminase/alanine dehydrogenase-like protein (mu-crystallin family)